MSNNYWDEEDDDLDTIDETTVTDGRKNPLRKVTREQEKRIKELTERLEKFERQEREAVVSKVLENKGVNTKAARLILKDLEDVNEETVNGWLNENGDLFGLTPADVTPAVSDADRQAILAQDALTQGALTPNRIEDLEYRIENAQSQEELNSILYSANQS